MSDAFGSALDHLDLTQLAEQVADATIIDRAIAPERAESLSELSLIIIGALVRCLAERRALGSIEIEAIRRWPSAEASGHQSEAFFLARTASRIIQQRILEAIRDEVPLEARARATQTILSGLGALSHQIEASLIGAQVEAARRSRIGSREGLLGGLVEGGLTKDVAARRAARMGIPEARAYAVAVLSEVTPAGVAQHDQPDIRYKPLRDAVGRVASSFSRNVVTEVHGDELVVVMPLEVREHNEPFARRLAPELVGEVGAIAIAGIGSVAAGAGVLDRSYEDAVRALFVLRAAPSLGPVLTYERAIPYLLLLADPGSAVGVVRSCIDPLRRDDVRNTSDLVATLEAYLENAGNAVAAARQLGVHRHTVNARIERIARITGYDVDDPAIRVLFQISIYASGLLSHP